MTPVLLAALLAATPEATATRALSDAATWYALARARKDELESFDAAEASYREALSALGRRPEDCAACDSDLACAACDGLAQASARRDNSWDAFRNAFAATWWFLGEDATLEHHELDYFKHAVDAAWADIETGVTYQRVPKFITVVRCFDDVAGPPARCDVLRDKLLALLARNSRFNGLPDEQGRLQAGAGWSQLLRARGAFPTEPLAKVAAENTTSAVLVLDLVYASEVSTPGGTRVSRVELAAHLWDAKSATVTGLGGGTGLAEDRTARGGYDLAWVAALLLLALALGLFHWTTAGERRPAHPFRHLAAAAVSFLAGAVVGRYAGELSGKFPPDWGMGSVSHGGMLPRPSALLWPLTHGAVALGAPPLVVALAVIRFREKVSRFFGDAFTAGLALPAVEAGAVASLFAPLVTNWPVHGPATALALGGAAVALAAAGGRPLGTAVDWLRGDTGQQVLPARALGAVVLTVVVLALLLPLGMFRNLHGGAPPPLHLAAAVLAGLAALVVHGLGRGSPREDAADRERPPVAGADVSLPHAFEWVDRAAASPAAWVERFSAPGLHVQLVTGPAGAGKSALLERTALLLRAQKTKSGGGWAVGMGTARRPLDERDATEPFQVTSDALSEALKFGRLARSLDQAEKTEALLASAVDLPGLGLLLGDSSQGTSTRKQLLNDVCAAVRTAAETRPVALLVDDLQWADEGSFELLLALVESLRARPPANPVVLLCGSRDEGPSAGKPLPDMAKRFRDALQGETLTLGGLSRGELEALVATNLKGAGDVALDADTRSRVVDALQQVFGEGKLLPGSLLRFFHALETAGEGAWRTGLDGRRTLLINPEDAWTRIASKAETEGVRARLEAFPEDDLLILECAAEVGRSFSATDVSNGLGRPRMEVLQALRRIDEKTDLVNDVPNAEDQFRFDSELTREVLRRRVQPENRGDLREIAREMHYRIAAGLLQQQGVSPFRLLEHCLFAGERMKREAASAALACLERTVERHALTDAQALLERVAAHGLERHLAPADFVRFQYLRARSLRGGVSDVRLQASKILRTLLDEAEAPSQEVLLAWLENRYFDRDAALRTQVEAWQEEARFADPLLRSTLDFFALLLRAQGDAPEIFGEALQEALAGLVSRLEALSPGRQRDGLLARVVQEQANELARRKPTQGPPVEDARHEAFSERAKALKQGLGDVEGLAVTAGMHGAFILFGRLVDAPDDHPHREAWARKAISLFEEDLLLLDRIGDNATAVGAWNKLARCKWELARSPSLPADERDRLRHEALAGTTRSLVHAERKWDVLHAAHAVLLYARVLEDEQVLQRAIDAASRADLWGSKMEDMARGFREVMAPLAERHGARPNWQALAALVQETPKPQAAA